MYTEPFSALSSVQQWTTHKQQHALNVVQLGTCYMHLGYEPVRELLKEYGLGDSEVGLGSKYLAREKNGQQRKVGGYPL
jgi:hypothetical protein